MPSSPKHGSPPPLAKANSPFDPPGRHAPPPYRLMSNSDLFGHIHDPVALAIERLREFDPSKKGDKIFWLADSFGKDSCCVLRLLQMSGVPFEAHHNFTGLDAPELIRFGREHHSETQIDRGPLSYFQLVARKGYSTRHSRWCCDALKEHGGAGRFVVTGVRRAESACRSGRKMVDHNAPKRKRLLNPIVDWTDADVWAFIRDEKVPYCCLYDEGFTRLGCIACPMAGSDQRKMELIRWPKFRPAFLLAFSRLIADRRSKGKWNDRQWPDAHHLLAWWLSNAPAATKAQEWFDFD